MKILNSILILFIKTYKFFISPYLQTNCRYLPTCSEYFIETLELNGPFVGFWMGIKRILRCHPIKCLGGNEGFDPATKIQIKKVLK